MYLLQSRHFSQHFHYGYLACRTEISDARGHEAKGSVWTRVVGREKSRRPDTDTGRIRVVTKNIRRTRSRHQLHDKESCDNCYRITALFVTPNYLTPS